MNVKITNYLFLLALGLMIACSGPSEKNKSTENTWTMGPFERVDSVNPVLQPSRELSFTDPIIQQPILWEEKDVFNPAAVVKDNKVYLLYRAEDKIGEFKGTSRIGMAISDDGLHFTKQSKPVFYPEEDSMKVYEWPGGCEDPRIVESDSGLYIMTYTAYDGTTARLCVATSNDLSNWEKKGLAFKSGEYRDLWSKSGSIISRRDGGKIIAAKINGKYWMYWGDSNIYLATSDNLVDWNPLEDSTGNLKPIIRPRPGKFDSELVESGPPAILGDNGILLIYNSKNSAEIGDKSLPEGTYSAGQVLFDKNDPSKIIHRLQNYFFTPVKPYEITGQVNNVCFLEGLVKFKGKYLLYYGTADSKIAVAICE